MHQNVSFDYSYQVHFGYGIRNYLRTTHPCWPQNLYPSIKIIRPLFRNTKSRDLGSITIFLQIRMVQASSLGKSSYN